MSSGVLLFGDAVFAPAGTIREFRGKDTLEDVGTNNFARTARCLSRRGPGWSWAAVTDSST
jgi:hypothetical protein